MENSEFGFIHKIEQFLDVCKENPTSDISDNYEEIIKKWLIVRNHQKMVCFGRKSDFGEWYKI